MIKCTISNYALQTTVGNVICGMRICVCVCESHDVKIFLILALFDSIAATFLSDPHPSNTTGMNQSPPILGRWSH